MTRATWVGRSYKVQKSNSSKGNAEYLLLSDAAQSHYLHKGQYRVQNRGANEYEVVKNLALASLISNRM